MLAEKTNAETVNAIERAMFVVCLDDSAPVTPTEVGRAVLYDARNRFYDKTIEVRRRLHFPDFAPPCPRPALARPALRFRAPRRPAPDGHATCLGASFRSRPFALLAVSGSVTQKGQQERHTPARRVPAQMWASPGADVGESRRRCEPAAHICACAAADGPPAHICAGTCAFRSVRSASACARSQLVVFENGQAAFLGVRARLCSCARACVCAA